MSLPSGVKWQSTKSAALNQTTKNALASKVANQKKAKDKQQEYNAMSNHNIQNPPTVPLTQAQKPQSKAQKVKKDYSALPRVPTTHHVNIAKLLMETFYAGYRPLSLMTMQPASAGAAASRKKKTIFDLGLDEGPMWLYSASGFESFPEWDGVPYDHYKDLKPFTPPNAHKKTKLEKAVEKVKAMEREAVEEVKPKVQRGRKRPINVLKSKK